jgi:hypothetical protein
MNLSEQETAQRLSIPGAGALRSRSSRVMALSDTRLPSAPVLW